MRKVSRIEGDKKLCTECDTFLTFDRFTSTKRSLGGLSCYCKSCRAGKYKNPEKTRQATARYREKNREKYLSNHRLTQFYRKTRIKAVTDSTVTTEFLKKLYSTEICVYCEQFTEKHLRTADHVVALINGGIHSASNLVMACFSCNSSKGPLSKEEFITKIKKWNIKIQE